MNDGGSAVHVAAGAPPSSTAYATAKSPITAAPNAVSRAFVSIACPSPSYVAAASNFDSPPTGTSPPPGSSVPPPTRAGVIVSVAVKVAAFA